MSTPTEMFIENGETTTDLVPSISVENMINMRAAAIDRYSTALRLIHEADDIAAKGHVGNLRIEIRTSERDGCPILAPEALSLITQEVDKGAWAYLMNESGLRTFMDATARKAW